MVESKEVEFSISSIELGEVSWDSQHDVVITINDVSKLDYWEVSCSCTKVRIDGSNIHVNFNVANAVGERPAPGTTATRYRFVEFYLDPGVPEFVPDFETRRRSRNPEKKSIRIPINFTAVA